MPLSTRTVPTRLAALCIPLFALSAGSLDADETPITAADVTARYVELAHAGYVDSLDAARALHESVMHFLEAPDADRFAATKAAWVHAHVVYSRTETLRFGNPNVDAWEGGVNAWPMDEGLIDYVADGYVAHEGNPYARANLIVNGVYPITDELIGALQGGSDPKAFPNAQVDLSDIETNVTRGYHAIEFLLWGQDLNLQPGTCGQRPFTDYLTGDACTNGRCDRRRDYLSAATRRLLRDLRFAVVDWDAHGTLYAKRFAELPLDEQLDRMIVGLGTMSFGELASERMQVALLTSDQEEEQSCFSDTTHLAIRANAQGIENMYLGVRQAPDDTRTDGPSLSSLVRRLDPALDDRVLRAFAATRERADAIVAAAAAGTPFDEQIGADDEDGRARVAALIDALREQTEALEAVRARRAELVTL